MALVGIDIGTQSLKAVVVDETGAILGQGSVAYAPSYPKPGWAEQSPSLWTNALAPAIGLALAEAKRTAADIKAVGVSGQLDGCLGVDAAGRPSTTCLIWMDRRAELPNLDPDRFRDSTGLVADASHMAAKARWLFGAERFHQPVSYLVEALTGENVFDHGLASTTMLYDLSARTWSDEWMAAFGLLPDQFPRIAEAHEIAGGLTKDGAELTGLAEGTPVAVGTGDDFATPLGAGAIEPGTVACVLGTAEVVGTHTKDLVLDEGGLVETHGSFDGLYFVENPGWMAGGALRWLGELLSCDDVELLSKEAETVPPGADGLTFLPALSGAMAPEWIESARGCFYGLTPAHTRGHLMRAVLEGCAFAMRDVVDRIRALGVATERIALLGGGARSALWAQIRADVSGLPVEVSEQVDSCPVGAALLAGVAVGVFPTVGDAAERARAFSARCDPAHDLHAPYQRYRTLFDSLRPLY